jgi:DNA-binding PadR family transcriptional regulator
MTELTDFEGAVLAQIGHGGPITAYAVAKRTAASTSEFWSGSAGAVYPLIKRLAARRLLASTEAQDGKRARTDYVLSAEGRKALKAWLLDAHRASDLGFDPLRTRLVHMDQCSASERKRFMHQVAALLEKAAGTPAPTDDPRLLALHETLTRARLEWFKAFERVLSAMDEPAHRRLAAR